MCLCISVCLLMQVFVKNRPEEGMAPLGAEITSICKLPDMGSRKRVLGFCTSGVHSSLMNRLCSRRSGDFRII